jgi:isocitrate lyase
MSARRIAPGAARSPTGDTAAERVSRLRRGRCGRAVSQERMAFAGPIAVRKHAGVKRAAPARTPVRAAAGAPRAKQSRVAELRQLLSSSNDILLMPCCYDALSARLVQRAGFSLTFMSGFSVAASKGLPDTGLLSYAEMRDAIVSITETLSIPMIADADTGGGPAPNVRRTVLGYAAAGAAGLLIEGA